MIDVNKIPGMIESVEREMLERYALKSNLNKGCIVELGSYFGKSTACLINGVIRNTTYTHGIKIFSFDKFETKKKSSFTPYVLKDAKRANLLSALIQKNNKINFKNIYSYFTREYENKILKTHEVDIKNMKLFKNKISLLFIDCTKGYSDTNKVLDCYFKKVLNDGTIIFQDFFYHWSAGMIAVVSLLSKFNCIEITSSYATSLVVKKKKNISKDLNKKIHELKKKNFHLEIEEIKKVLRKINIYNFNIFYPRLICAQIQNCIHNKNYEISQYYLGELYLNKNFFNETTYSDLIDLISNRFHIKEVK